MRQERLHAFHFGEGEWSGGKKGHGTILCTSPKAVVPPKEVRWLWEEKRRMEGTLLWQYYSSEWEQNMVTKRRISGSECALDFYYGHLIGDVIA